MDKKAEAEANHPNEFSLVQVGHDYKGFVKQLNVSPRTM